MAAVAVRVRELQVLPVVHPKDEVGVPLGAPVRRIGAEPKRWLRWRSQGSELVPGAGPEWSPKPRR